MRNTLDLNTVRVYVAVVNEQSFAGAARLLSLPSSNVSRHVASLERMLGVRLLERSTRHLRMTEAGRLLYERAKLLLDALLSTEECSGLMYPDTNLGENARHGEVFDEQAKTYIFP